MHVVTHGEKPVTATFVARTEDSRGDFIETPAWQENYFFTTFLITVFCYVTKILQVESSVSIDSISVITIFVNGHHSHLEISVLDVANNMGSRLFCFPAHCSYELQPVHESLFKSLKSPRNETLGIHRRQRPGMAF